MTLAMSSDRLDRRLSLLGPEVPSHPVGGVPEPVPEHMANLDLVMQQAAGMAGPQSSGPSARHLRSRRCQSSGQMVRRSASVKLERQSRSCRQIPPPRGSKDDLHASPPASPVPPCPPLRGEDFYSVASPTAAADANEIYVTRDDLYAQQSQQQHIQMQQLQMQQQQELQLQHQQQLQQQEILRQRQLQQQQLLLQQQHQQALLQQEQQAATHRRGQQAHPAAPRPPQRTVSFLAGNSLPRKMSQVARAALEETDAGGCHGRQLSQGATPSRCAVSPQCHNRSLSNPAAPPKSPPLPPPPPAFSNNARLAVETSPGKDQDLPLPPPPYISPPTHRIQNCPLPPPPPCTTDSPASKGQAPPPTMAAATRPPCDSASSSSSIDSGYGRSSYHGECQQQQAQAQVQSQAQPASPGWSSGPDSAVFEPRPASSSSSQQTQNSSSSVPSPPPPLHPRESHYAPVPAAASNAANVSSSSLCGLNSCASAASLRGRKKTVRIQDPENAENAQNEQQQQQALAKSPAADDDVFRRRQYRVGLNLFNADPELGMEYLLKKNFLDFSPAAAAKFLLGRKGLSKKRIGEYLSNLQEPFALSTLHHFMQELDFSGLHLDIALRHLQQELVLPGEAQRIEKVVEVFSRRYIACNQMFVAGFRSPDTLFMLSFAIVMLNTDLHSRAVKQSRRMRKEDFLRNLRGVDAGQDIDLEMLQGIYDRIKAAEFQPGSDHVTQVAKVEETLTHKGRHWKPLAELQRRLVCFCRLTEIPAAELAGKERVRPGAHQRGVFLFNDVMLVTKSETRRKGRTVHAFRAAVPLAGLRVNTFSTSQYAFGVQLQERASGRVAVTFNARSASDQQRFVGDLQEAIAECVEMDKGKMFLNKGDREGGGVAGRSQC